MDMRAGVPRKTKYGNTNTCPCTSKYKIHSNNRHCPNSCVIFLVFGVVMINATDCLKNPPWKLQLQQPHILLWSTIPASPDSRTREEEEEEEEEEEKEEEEEEEKEEEDEEEKEEEKEEEDD
ncbi:hypothetical protein WISP_93306 [Willisornis vidua]|uniref:Uncharacterized protein n=1 Tax=Willisornis vidua TaxID=1566151 RepID=A0ABQ9D6S8_9PASS|nr:hypothetical protein WISP_93306 [Willisornis vidua]